VDKVIKYKLPHGFSLIRGDPLAVGIEIAEIDLRERIAGIRVVTEDFVCERVIALIACLDTFRYAELSCGRP